MLASRLGMMTLAALLAASMPASAAKKKIVLAGETIELHTNDGWTLQATYQEAAEDQLTFILLHESRGRRTNWYILARRLVKDGIGYLALDLRGHGASTGAPEGEPTTWRKFRVSKQNNPWDNMREDVAAAVEFLKAVEVPEDSIALGGAGVGGSVAMKYAALHPEIDRLFLLSPGFSFKEVLTVNAMRAYKDRQILLVVGNDDRRSATETPILYQFAKVTVGEERAHLMRVARGHGTRMMWTDRGLAAKILDWMVSDSEGGEIPAEDPLDPLQAPDEEEEDYGSEDGDLPSDEDLRRLTESPAYSPAF